MKTKIKVFIPLVASVLSLAGCNRSDPTPTTVTPPGTSSTTGGGGGGSSKVQINIDTTAYGGYYANWKSDLEDYEGGSLNYNLHRLCVDTHTNTIRYSQFNSYIQASTSPRSVDESPNDSSKNVYFYTGKEVTKGTNGTREHVWPCANSSGLWVHSNYSSSEYYVDGSAYWGGGSDLYHVRPSTSAVNTARGNSKFIEFSAGQSYYTSSDGGPYVLKVDSDPAKGFASKSEPADEVKGDIVRIIMYVYIHYSKMGTYNWYYDEAKTKCVFGNLSLTQVFGYDTLEEVQAIMVKWNELDPVDDLERLRNDTVQQIQGNRNPFVDYPDLLRNCFMLYE